MLMKQWRVFLMNCLFKDPNFYQSFCFWNCEKRETNSKLFCFICYWEVPGSLFTSGSYLLWTSGEILITARNETTYSRWYWKELCFDIKVPHMICFVAALLWLFLYKIKIPPVAEIHAMEVWNRLGFFILNLQSSICKTLELLQMWNR